MGQWKQPYATDVVSLGSAVEPYDSDMTHSYRLTEGRLIRYPLSHGESVDLNYLISLNPDPLRNGHPVIFFLARMYLTYEVRAVQTRL